jgi:hypothetical protein
MRALQSGCSYCNRKDHLSRFCPTLSPKPKSWIRPSEYRRRSHSPRGYRDFDRRDNDRHRDRPQESDRAYRNDNRDRDRDDDKGGPEISEGIKNNEHEEEKGKVDETLKVDIDDDGRAEGNQKRIKFLEEELKKEKNENVCLLSCFRFIFRSSVFLHVMLAHAFIIGAVARRGQASSQ